MNKAFRFLRIVDIDFSIVTYFQNDEIKKATVLQQINPISTDQPYGTCEFTLVTDNPDFSIIEPVGEYGLLQYRQPIFVYEKVDADLVFMGKFFLDDWESKTQNQTEIKAIDLIGTLKDRQLPINISKPILSNTTTTTGSNVNTKTFSHITANNADRVLVVSVTLRAGNSVTGITYNGDALTKLADKEYANGDHPRAELWYLVTPDAGTYNVIVSFSGNEYFTVNASTFYRCNTTTPFPDFETYGGTAGTFGLAIAGVGENDIVLDMVCALGGTGQITAVGRTSAWGASSDGNWAGEGCINNNVYGDVTTYWTTTSRYAAITAILAGKITIENVGYYSSWIDDTAQNVLSGVLGSAGVEYSLDSSLNALTVTGLSQSTNYRDFLQKVAFSIGAYLSCAGSSGINILPIELAADIITPDYIFTSAEKGLTGQNVTLRPLVTGVEVVANNWDNSAGGTAEQMFAGNLTTGTHIVMTNKLQDDAAGTIGGGSATLLDYGANYAIFSVTVAGDKTYSNTPAQKNQKTWAQYLPSASALVPNIVRIDNGDFTYDADSADILTRLSAYYAQRYVQKMRLFATLAKAGDTCQIDTFGGRQLIGQIERAEYNLTGGFIAKIEAVCILVEV
jgi:hypothetical protein